MGFDLSPGERAGHGRAEENIDTEHHLKHCIGNFFYYLLLLLLLFIIIFVIIVIIISFVGGPLDHG